MERRLTAIVAADVVGYSRLIRDNEAGTLASIKAHREDLIEPIVSARKGRIVKLMGDGLLIEFASAVDRVATVSSERSRAVKLALDEDRLILSVNAPDSGAAEEELAVAYGDDRLEIGFNAKYLLEIASQVDRENAVFLFNSAGDPTLMREGSDQSAVYVVMPMRV